MREMNSGESGQDGQRGKEIFQRKVAKMVTMVTEMKSGESGQGDGQDLETIENAVAYATEKNYGEWAQDGELAMEMLLRAVDMALDIIETWKELFSPLPVHGSSGTVPSSDDSPSNCCYPLLADRIHKLGQCGQGEALTEYTRVVDIPAEDVGFTMDQQVYMEELELRDAFRVFDVPNRARRDHQNIRVGGRPYTIRSAPHLRRSIIEPRGPPIHVLDRARGSHQSVRVGVSPAAAHAHLRSIIGAAGPNIQAMDPTGSFEIGGSTARARGYGGSQTVFLDSSGGRFVAIPINTLQQGDHGFLATAGNAKDGPRKVVEDALISSFGGVVVLCFSTLDNTLKENCPGYIRATMYAGLVVITGTTFVGLISNKRTKAAFKVVASAAVAAVSTAVVINVSENAYIKATCGVLGALATLATAAIHW